MAPPKSRPSFEDFYRQLEEKVVLLEQGGLSLDDSLSTFEEAMSLAQRCQQLLDRAELRITRLRDSLNGGENPSRDEEDYSAEDDDA
jgi:exodeoxyribonuclease VII small subunit